MVTVPLSLKKWKMHKKFIHKNLNPWFKVFWHRTHNKNVAKLYQNEATCSSVSKTKYTNQGSDSSMAVKWFYNFTTLPKRPKSSEECPCPAKFQRQHFYLFSQIFWYFGIFKEVLQVNRSKHIQIVLKTIMTINNKKLYTATY